MAERTAEVWVDGRGWVEVRPEVAIRLLHLRGAQRTREWREHKEAEMEEPDEKIPEEHVEKVREKALPAFWRQWHSDVVVRQVIKWHERIKRREDHDA